MDSFNGGLLGNDLSLWISFLFSLMIFSMILGDNLLAKLAQYILVGVSLGYLGVLAIQHVLRPRLFRPLWEAPLAHPALWGALALGFCLCVAGIERIWAQSQPTESIGSGWRRILLRLGGIPVAILLGVGVSVVFIGILQGTLWPLFWHTARTGLSQVGSLGTALTSVFVLLLTTATLLYWTIPVAEITAGQPSWVRYLLRGWVAVGKRALWFSAGILFARLFASHLSLLIARMEFFLYGLLQSTVWQWAEGLWRGLTGG